MDTVLVARPRKIGERTRIDRLSIPNPRPSDVLIQVKAALSGILERNGGFSILVAVS